MPATKLKRFLDENDIRYVSIPHFQAFTAQETAAAAHVHGREVAKTVMVKVDGALAMVVLPATRRLDLELLRAALGAGAAELASEAEFKSMFPDCEIGAMPPFGNLYGVKVYVDGSLAEDDQIAFNAGTHAEMLQMAYGDFERLVRPMVVSVAYRTRQPV
jgi:Ala-tRNA(Pro) deacylase